MCITTDAHILITLKMEHFFTPSVVHISHMGELFICAAALVQLETLTVIWNEM